jgi:hypothetical protein
MISRNNTDALKTNFSTFVDGSSNDRFLIFWGWVVPASWNALLEDWTDILLEDWTNMLLEW